MKWSGPKVLSSFLALIGGVFGLLGAIGSARQLRTYFFWPRADAAVEEININPIGDNAYGNISVRLRHSNGSSEKSVWASKSFLSGRGEKFARKYAIGTQHTIWIDPATPEKAEVELGWNLETLLTPVFLYVVCGCLLLAARYFWRF